MRVFIIVLVLIFTFQSLSKADDISDFEIEGMSVGDSLLDHFSREEIEDNIMNDYYKHLPSAYQKTYKSIEFYNLPRFEVYHNVSIDFLMEDNKFINKTISGTLFIDNAEECYTKQKQIDKELSIIFKNTEREINDSNHGFDKTGNSKTKAINYWFDSGDVITLICTDWSNEITKTYGWYDNLSLEIKSKEYNYFLQEAYK